MKEIHVSRVFSVLIIQCFGREINDLDTVLIKYSLRASKHFVYEQDVKIRNVSIFLTCTWAMIAGNALTDIDMLNLLHIGSLAEYL